MADVPFSFPVLHIPEVGGKNDWSCWIGSHSNSDSFTRGNRKAIKEQVFVGSIIMDIDGRTWRLLKLVDLGQDDESWFGRIIMRMFGVHKIHYELSKELKLSLSEIKNHLDRLISADPESYLGVAAAEDENLSDEQRQDQVNILRRKFREAISPLELIAIADYNRDVIWPPLTAD